jgi:hypothetical protein
VVDDIGDERRLEKLPVPVSVVEKLRQIAVPGLAEFVKEGRIVRERRHRKLACVPADGRAGAALTPQLAQALILAGSGVEPITALDHDRLRVALNNRLAEVPRYEVVGV